MTKTVAKPKRKSNLKGRLPGVKNKSTLFKEAMKEGFEKLLEKESKKVFIAVVEKAKEGDMTAAKMILDRVVPVTKAVDINASDVKAGMGITINIDQLVASTRDPETLDQDIEDAEIIEDGK